MEYLELIKKYWSMNEELPQSYSITCMYLFLLNSWDENNKEDFEISDYDISKKLTITRVSIRKNRKVLRDLGLINYQINKGLPTLYKIIPDYVIRNKGKEVVSVAEKEKTITKKAVSPTLPPIVQEKPIKPVQQVQEQIVLPTAPIESPKLPLTLLKSRQVTKELSNIPSLDEFMEYAKTLPIYEEGLDEHIKIKYEIWKENNWVNGNGKPIINWQQTLKNTIPYLKSNNQAKNIFNVPKLNSIPKINRPKATYNE